MGVLRGFWLGAGVRDWRLLFPGSCHVRGERLAGSGTGRSTAASGGAAGVLEAASREPDDGAAGNRSRGGWGGFGFAFGSVPWSGLVRAVPLAAVIPSRVPGRGRGRMGRGRGRGGGRAGAGKR